MSMENKMYALKNVNTEVGFMWNHTYLYTYLRFQLFVKIMFQVLYVRFSLLKKNA